MTTRPQAKKKRHSTKPLDAPQSLVGRVLDARFRLDEVLSRGGMGIVFKGTQLTVNRTVAVKILRPTLSSESDLVQRFSQEVELVASLCHPNIVSLVDAGRGAGGLTYLAMEFVEGKTFRAALKDGELTLAEILEVLIQTCDALMEAHAAEIVHRDLKFDNIMLTRHQDARLHVKILDFGVAKLMSKNLELTRSGQVPGTPGIIAPELIDENPPTPQSDLYSLGVLLYTALCGEAPFTADNDLALMRAHKFQEVPSMQDRVARGVPDDLLELTYRLLEKEPELRPRTAQNVRERLETVLSKLRRSGIPSAPYEPGSDDYEVGTGDTRDDVFDKPETGWEAEALRVPEEPDSAFDRFARAFFGEEPVVAPTTVVVGLAILLFVLVLTIIYMIVPGLLGLLFSS